MKRLSLGFLLGFAFVLLGQSSYPRVTSSLTVRHLHEGGWGSHVMKLELTTDALLLSGTQKYSSASGSSGYCIFPAEIRLERILAVEAKNDPLVNGLKIFSATSHSSTILLHLEYRDDHGGTHSYNLIPSDAEQWNNEWSGGDADAVREFAESLKYAAALRAQQLRSAAGPRSDNRASPVRDPITGDEIEPPDARSAVLPDASAGDSEGAPKGAAIYKAQLCLANTCRVVTVWPVSPVDPTRLRVVDDLTSNLLIDVPHKDISAVKTRQHTVELSNPPPGQIVALSVPFPFGSAGAPRVYQVCLRIRFKNDKQINQCFISDLASCHVGVPCQEGMDGGRHMLELERQIKNALGTEHTTAK